MMYHHFTMKNRFRGVCEFLIDFAVLYISTLHSRFLVKAGKMQYDCIAMKARHLFIVRARNARLIWMTTYINQWWVKPHHHSVSSSGSLTSYLISVAGQIHLSELFPSLHYLCEMTINMIITNWVQFICTSFNENSNRNLHACQNSDLDGNISFSYPTFHQVSWFFYKLQPIIVEQFFRANVI